VISVASSSLRSLNPPKGHPDASSSRCLLPCCVLAHPPLFLSTTLVDPFPTTDIVIDGPFLSEKPKVPSLLAMPRTPSPSKPLPITLSSTSSSPNSTDKKSPDSASPRDPIDPPPSSATYQPKVLSSGLTKRTHALIELIDSEHAYVSDLALIRDVHLPAALGMCHIFCCPHIAF
jgi:hypothetical protein